MSKEKALKNLEAAKALMPHMTIHNGWAVLHLPNAIGLVSLGDSIPVFSPENFTNAPYEPGQEYLSRKEVRALPARYFDGETYVEYATTWHALTDSFNNLYTTEDSFLLQKGTMFPAYYPGNIASPATVVMQVKDRRCVYVGGTGDQIKDYLTEPSVVLR